MQNAVQAGTRAGKFIRAGKAGKFVRRAKMILSVSAITLRGFIRTRRFIQDRPLIAELLAVGTGYVLGRALWSRRRR